MSETGFVEVEEGRLFSVRDGSGPAVVLIHGAPILDHRMWAGQVDALAATGTVVRYDLRGYGRSSSPEGPYRHCDDLAALISTLGLNSPVLCGMSFGATVALDTAFAHPDVVSGLILAPLAPLPGWTWLEGFPLAPALELAGSEPTEAVVEAILALPMNEPVRRRPDAMAALRQMGASYSGWHLSHRDPGEWAVADAADRLGDVSVPTLTIVGDHDVLDIRMISDKIAAEVPDAQQVVVAGAGHNPNLEDPGAFNHACLSFLDRIRR